VKRWTLTIDGHVTMSYNSWKNLPRMRRGRRPRKGTHYQQSEVTAWYYLLLEAGVRDIPPAGREKKRKVHVVRQSPRPIDRLNAATPIDKAIADNLVRLGVLVDDSERWAEISYATARGPKGMRIEVRE
jgi:hypothetical protein